MVAVLVLIGWNSLRSQDPVERQALTAGSGGSDAGQQGVRRDPVRNGLTLAAGGRRIVVDVSGAVKRPGVYRFAHGQRVIDAIRRAGGPTRDAYPSGINRAALLADGQQVVVPSAVAVGDAGAAAGPEAASAGAGVAAADAPISLGSATQAQLEEIEGIGPVTAQSILEFRDSQGGVASIDELDEVSGIGPVTMEALRSRLQP
jgi:competence protein ComEA